MDTIMAMDLYGLLGVKSTASTSEITKAYRKKALTCHPDKNPDNPRAAELFQELSKVLEILTDAKTRAEYDQAITAKEQAKKRIRQFDAKRKKFKDDLEAREKACNRVNEEFNVEIKRLQEYFKNLQEEIEASRKKELFTKYNSTLNETASNIGEFRIKIRWKISNDDQINGGYNNDNLREIFSKYGDIVALVISSKKKGSAMIEFEDRSAAETALLAEIGFAHNPLTLRGLWETQKRSSSAASNTNLKIGNPIFPATASLNNISSSFVSFPSAPNIFTQLPKTDIEFENSVLANLRRAEERKRLIEDLKAQEET